MFFSQPLSLSAPSAGRAAVELALRRARRVAPAGGVRYALRMLHLRYETPAAWAEAALRDETRLLLDHRFCESKAAAMADAMARAHGARHPTLVPLLRAVAGEEREHTALCDALLRERGDPHLAHHGNPYVSALRAFAARRGGGLLDQLVLAGTIEARSCERFRLLAVACRGRAPGLGAFYEDLFASEARHHALFVGLAVDLFGEERALARLDELTTFEARVVAARPWGPHIH